MFFVSVSILKGEADMKNIEDFLSGAGGQERDGGRNTRKRDNLEHQFEINDRKIAKIV